MKRRTKMCSKKVVVLLLSLLLLVKKASERSDWRKTNTKPRPPPRPSLFFFLSSLTLLLLLPDYLHIPSVQQRSILRLFCCCVARLSLSLSATPPPKIIETAAPCWNRSWTGGGGWGGGGLVSLLEKDDGKSDIKSSRAFETSTEQVSSFVYLTPSSCVVSPLSDLFLSVAPFVFFFFKPKTHPSAKLLLAVHHRRIPAWIPGKSNNLC
jgi:hypothetical protein